MKNLSKKTYHIGFGKRKNTLVIQATRCVDFLSCEIYDYMGERQTTKKHLYQNRYNILAMAKQNNPKIYGKLKYAVVE